MAAGDKALVQAKYPQAKAVKASFGFQIVVGKDCLAVADSANMAWKKARGEMWRREHSTSSVHPCNQAARDLAMQQDAEVLA